MSPRIALDRVNVRKMRDMLLVALHAAYHGVALTSAVAEAIAGGDRTMHVISCASPEDIEAPRSADANIGMLPLGLLKESRLPLDVFAPAANGRGVRRPVPQRV